MTRIYLDYNASTPIAHEVLNEMQLYLTSGYGNPSSSHWASESLQEAIGMARSRVAKMVGCDSGEIVFTSGGSEANNHALKGIYFALRDRGKHIITTQIEHPAVLEPCRFLESIGAEVTYVGVDEFGRVSLDEIEQAITDRTILISVMHANNEIGTVQPLSEISRIARKHGIYLHTDAAQSIGKIPVNVDELGVDLLTVAGHKFYAPKGIGALYIRKGTPIEPFVHGAGHESGRRAGTENILYLAGLGKAAELVEQDQPCGDVLRLGEQLWQGLRDHFQDKVSLNGHPVQRLPNTYSINFHGMSGREVLSQLPEIAASTGSACHTGSTALSSVLQAMKVREDAGRGAVRFSLGRYTTPEEIETAIRLIIDRITF